MSKTIKQTYQISAPIEEVWKALVDPESIKEWGGGPAKMNEKIGMRFSFWGGDIYGTNTDVKKPRCGKARLEQDWYGGRWDKPSKVVFSLKKDGDEKTILELTHTDLPEEEVTNFDSGWKDYYLGPMKEYLERK